MQKILVMMMTFALTIAAQAEKIDSTQFVAFYNYTIQTQDDEGQDVTDSIWLALLVGTRATYCTTVSHNCAHLSKSPKCLFHLLLFFANIKINIEKNKIISFVDNVLPALLCFPQGRCNRKGDLIVRSPQVSMYEDKLLPLKTIIKRNTSA